MNHKGLGFFLQYMFQFKPQYNIPWLIKSRVKIFAVSLLIRLLIINYHVIFQEVSVISEHFRISLLLTRKLGNIQVPCTLIELLVSHWYCSLVSNVIYVVMTRNSLQLIQRRFAFLLRFRRGHFFIYSKLYKPNSQVVDISQVEKVPG